MRTALLRKKDISLYWKYYSSRCCCKVNRNESLLSTKLCSFSSSTKFSNCYDESTQSNYLPPPDPIPNRPLRAVSLSQRPRSISNPAHSTTTFSRSSDKNENQIRPQDGEDFLKRFQLGFDRKEESPSVSPAFHPKGERSETPPPEAPPAHPEDADEIFKKMKETGLIPNAVAMLDGLCKDGLVQEAMKLFGLMREKGTIPEVVIYTAVVEGFCKAQKYDDALRIFLKMQGNGLADGFCKEKSLEDAQSMIKSVRQKGFILDEKAVRQYLDRKGPFSPLVWEAILGKKASQRQSLF